MTNKNYKTIKQMLESGDQETITFGINILGATMSSSDFNLIILLNTWCEDKIDVAKAILNLFPSESENIDLNSIAAALKLYCIFKDKILEDDMLTIKQKIEQTYKQNYKKIKKLIPKSVADIIEDDLNKDKFNFFDISD